MIFYWYYQSILTLIDHIPAACCIGCYYRLFHGHRLEQGSGDPFPVRRQYHQIRDKQYFRYVRSLTQVLYQPIAFRLWPQGRELDSIRIDFGDGRIVERYAPYSTVTHRFKAPGIHAVTASASAGGLPVMQRVKVIVD